MFLLCVACMEVCVGERVHHQVARAAVGSLVRAHAASRLCQTLERGQVQLERTRHFWRCEVLRGGATETRIVFRDILGAKDLIFMFPTS